MQRWRWRVRLPDIRGRFEGDGPFILYALTPTPAWRNVGDHGQVVAIYGWLQRFFPQHRIVELNKDEVIQALPHVSHLVPDDAPIVLHSGGNLGDRGIWSETGRRMIIERFPDHRIVSLPQTIYFSPTETGRRELERTRAIYNRHRHLVIIARDRRSRELAESYFPNCVVDVAPDFVLSYAGGSPRVPEASNGRALLCLREDNEALLTAEQRRAVRAALDVDYDTSDTTVWRRIGNHRRRAELDAMLARFARCEYVVTDRYHALIFAVLCRKPTVILPTVDHKVTSGIEWFEDCGFVRLVHAPDEVPEAIAAVRAQESRSVPDWNARYFDRLARYVVGG